MQWIDKLRDKHIIYEWATVFFFFFFDILILKRDMRAFLICNNLNVHTSL